MLSLLMEILVMVTGIAPPICQYLPPGEYVRCDVPAITEVCWVVTNYWPFNEAGELVPWNGQADGDPTGTAAGAKIHSVEQEWDWVGGPLPLINDLVCFPSGYCPPVWDTFGEPQRQAGVFWHDDFEQYVIGIDLFTPEPFRYLECGGYIIAR